MKNKSKKWDVFVEKYLPYIEILGDVADILIHVSARPQPKDFLAVGLASGRVISKIVQKAKESSSEQFQNFFEDNNLEHWYIGEGLKSFLYDIADNIEVYAAGRNDQIIGIDFGQEKIFVHHSSVKQAGQPQDDGQQAKSDSLEKIGICKEPWGISQDPSKLFEEIKKRVWKPNKYMMIDKKNGLSYKPFKDFSKHIETDFIKDLTNKISLAKKHDFLGRTYLIEGLPGTGKSSSSDYIVSKFKHKTIRVNLDFLDDNHWNETRILQSMSFADVLQLINIAGAEFVIFDDLDYIHSWNQNKLLSFFEELNENKTVTIVSVNDRKNLLPALRRPGRCDERIVVEGLDRKVLEQILEEDDMPFMDEFVSVPIAYVNEYKKRKIMYGQPEGLEFIREFNEEQQEPTNPPIDNDDDDEEIKQRERAEAQAEKMGDF